MKKAEKSVGKFMFSKKRAQKGPVPCLLFVDTASDETQVGIFVERKMLALKKWGGKGNLSETLLIQIEKLLKNCRLKLSDLNQISVFPGPGSYTGLRIGITVANFLAWSLGIPIFAAKIVDHKLSISGAENQQFILPKYFQPAKITRAKGRFSK